MHPWFKLHRFYNENLIFLMEAFGFCLPLAWRLHSQSSATRKFHFISFKIFLLFSWMLDESHFKPSKSVSEKCWNFPLQVSLILLSFLLFFYEFFVSFILEFTNCISRISQMYFRMKNYPTSELFSSVGNFFSKFRTYLRWKVLQLFFVPSTTFYFDDPLNEFRIVEALEALQHFISMRKFYGTI